MEKFFISNQRVKIKEKNNILNWAIVTFCFAYIKMLLCWNIADIYYAPEMAALMYDIYLSNANFPVNELFQHFGVKWWDLQNFPSLNSQMRFVINGLNVKEVRKKILYHSLISNFPIKWPMYFFKTSLSPLPNTFVLQCPLSPALIISV